MRVSTLWMVQFKLFSQGPQKYGNLKKSFPSLRGVQSGTIPDWQGVRPFRHLAPGMVWSQFPLAVILQSDPGFPPLPEMGP